MSQIAVLQVTHPRGHFLYTIRRCNQLQNPGRTNMRKPQTLTTKCGIANQQHFEVLMDKRSPRTLFRRGAFSCFFLHFVDGSMLDGFPFRKEFMVIFAAVLVAGLLCCRRGAGYLHCLVLIFVESIHIYIYVYVTNLCPLIVRHVCPYNEYCARFFPELSIQKRKTINSI